MNIIAQEARFRQRVVKYSQKHGVTEASIRYKVSRMSVYKWRAKYNGHWWSLKEHSHRPKHHPAEQTEEENDLIKRHYPYYDDMIMLWDRLREKGYKRCYQTKEHLDYLEQKYGIKIKRLKPEKPIPTCVKQYGVPFLSKYVYAFAETPLPMGGRAAGSAFEKISEV